MGGCINERKGRKNKEGREGGRKVGREGGRKKGRREMKGKERKTAKEAENEWLERWGKPGKYRVSG